MWSTLVSLLVCFQFSYIWSAAFAQLITASSGNLFVTATSSVTDTSFPVFCFFLLVILILIIGRPEPSVHGLLPRHSLPAQFHPDTWLERKSTYSDSQIYTWPWILPLNPSVYIIGSQHFHWVVKSWNFLPNLLSVRSSNSTSGKYILPVLRPHPLESPLTAFSPTCFQSSSKSCWLYLLQKHPYHPHCSSVHHLLTGLLIQPSTDHLGFHPCLFSLFFIKPPEGSLKNENQATPCFCPILSNDLTFHLE